jgi:integrase
MSSIRKREWSNNSGAHSAWILTYSDQDGKKRQETFERERDAKAREAEVAVNLRKGVHAPRSTSPTVAEVGDAWVEHSKLEGRQRTTVKQYRSHVELHLVPLRVGDDRRGYVELGAVKLSDLTTPFVEAIRIALLRKLSRPMAKKVFVSFRAILAYAMRKGLVAQNVAASAEAVAIDSRAKRKLEIGVDIPTREEVAAMIAHAGKLRPMLTVAAFSGLRNSELRGLRWSDVDLKGGRISVRQRMDRYNEIGRPKTKSSERTLPVGPVVIHTLQEWRLKCPKGDLDLVFPDPAGNDYPYQTSRFHLDQAQVAAGIAPTVGAPKYGWHSLRHFYASWCVNRRVDGGLELPLKTVSERLGHNSTAVTSDVYGHLFPSQDDGSELAAAERAVLALHTVGNAG